MDEQCHDLGLPYLILDSVQHEGKPAVLVKTGRNNIIMCKHLNRQE